MQKDAAPTGSRAVDQAAGLMCMVLGIGSAIHVLGWIPLGTPRNMGPGFFPLMLSALLAALGLLIALKAETRFEVTLPPSWRGLTAIFAAPLAFVATLEPLGFPIAVFAMVAISATASREIRMGEAILLGLAMSAFAVLLFWWGLKVQVDLVGDLFKTI